MGRILVVEDDPTVQRVLKRLFIAEGFTVETQSDGEGALDSFHALAPSAIILDLNLPKLSGRDLCRQVKAKSPLIPVIVVSASSEISDKVLLLESGADDYVTKPFSPSELLARVRVALRRSEEFETINPVSFGDIVVDFNKAEVMRDGQPVILTAGEFKTLETLVQNANVVVTRAELLKRVSGSQSNIDNRTIDNHVLRLRQKLERNPRCPMHILTVHSIGYKFVR